MVCRLILHATGQQTLGLLVVLLTYYLFALPLGISLMFATSLKLTGEDMIIMPTGHTTLLGR